MSVFRSKRIIILIGFLFIILFGSLGFYIFKNRHTLLQNENVQFVIPIYHSLRKIPDFLFIPVALIRGSDIEDNFDIYIPNENIAKLNRNLADAPFGGTLKDENKVWVNAEFRSGDYNGKIKIRYRGNLANHWNSYKKSYIIKFPKDNLFNGMREISLIIPIDRKYFSTSLNNYRAKKMGLIVPEEFYSHITINGADMGVYLSMEHWSQEWIEKNSISSLSKIYGTTDGVNLEDDVEKVSIYSKESIDRWKSWNNKELVFPEVETLMILLDASDEVFEEIAPLLLDLESFYAQDTLNVLTGGYHLSDDGNNLILIFDATEGRFKPVPFNAGLSDVDREFETSAIPLLQKRIYRIPEFKKKHDEYFNKYVLENREDDAEFVSSWISRMKKEFYKDNAMLENNISFLLALNKFQGWSLSHSNLKPEILDLEESEIKYSSLVAFPEEFKYLKDASISPWEFANIHKEFILSNNELILPAGSHWFTQTIIIPRGTKLTINAGANINMFPNISFVSYSPVDLNGIEVFPISFKQAVKGKNWGVFAVLNTERTNTVAFTKFSGGSEATINGAYISGMAAFHNTNTVVSNSSFSNTSGDDALNIKGGWVEVVNNLFEENLMDGIDLDFVGEDSVFQNNTFNDNGGDAIDLSWSNISILDTTVTNCGDKGVSIGERSNISLIKNLFVTECKVGIAIKDQSFASVVDTTLVGNDKAVSIYQKKPFFGGGIGAFENLILENNLNSFYTDEESSFTEKGIVYQKP